MRRRAPGALARRRSPRAPARALRTPCATSDAAPAPHDARSEAEVARQGRGHRALTGRRWRRSARSGREGANSRRPASPASSRPTGSFTTRNRRTRSTAPPASRSTRTASHSGADTCASTRRGAGPRGARRSTPTPPADRRCAPSTPRSRFAGPRSPTPPAVGHRHRWASCASPSATRCRSSTTCAPSSSARRCCRRSSRASSISGCASRSRYRFLDWALAVMNGNPIGDKVFPDLDPVAGQGPGRTPRRGRRDRAGSPLSGRHLRRHRDRLSPGDAGHQECPGVAGPERRRAGRTQRDPPSEARPRRRRRCSIALPWAATRASSCASRRSATWRSAPSCSTR